MIEIDHMLHEQIKSYGAETYKQFLCSEVIQNWDKLVDESICTQVEPVTIERGVLFVNIKSSAFKDQLKFFKEEIIAAINENFGKEKPLVKEIRLARGFQITNTLPEKKLPAQSNEPKVEDVILTKEEIQRCEEAAKIFPDAELRPIILHTLLSQVKLQKFHLEKGWHKCIKCAALCPPEEIFCEVCLIKERTAMVKKLSDILYDTPWLKTQDAQKILLKQMPNMRSECTANAINSARTSLIQNLASHIRFGDEESPNLLKLVMLEKRLTPDKLTPQIIKRTLSELQFNFSDGAKFSRKIR